MFLLPRALAAGDELTVSGLMTSERQKLDISLVTGDYSVDNQNVACQFSADFNSDRVAVSVIQNGVKENVGDYESYPAATDLMPERDFSFIFKINVSEYENEPSFNIYCGLSYVAAVELKFDLKQVRYLTLAGDVEKVESLQFKFR